MNLKVTKIVSMTSHVEATVNELHVSGEVRVRNNDTLDGIDSGNVKDASGNQIASFSYYGSSNLNINYNNTTVASVTDVSAAVDEFIKSVESDPSSVTVISQSE